MLPENHPSFENWQDRYEIVSEPPFLYSIPDNPPKPSNFIHYYNHLYWLESLLLKPNDLFLFTNSSKNQDSNIGSGWSIWSGTLYNTPKIVIHDNRVYVFAEGHCYLGTKATVFNTKGHIVLEILLWILTQKTFKPSSVTICKDNTATLDTLADNNPKTTSMHTLD